MMHAPRENHRRGVNLDNACPICGVDLGCGEHEHDRFARPDGSVPPVVTGPGGSYNRPYTPRPILTRGERALGWLICLSLLAVVAMIVAQIVGGAK